MEEQIPSEISVPSKKPGRNWLGIGLMVLGGFALIAVSTYAGYWYGKKQAAPSTFAPLTQPTPPTEGKIAFIRDKDIWVINPDGSREEKLIDNEDISAFHSERWSLTDPQWSPDGKRIAFVGDNGGRGLYIALANGENIQRNGEQEIGEDIDWESLIEWSPDGQRLTYEGLGSEIGFGQLIEISPISNFSSFEGRILVTNPYLLDNYGYSHYEQPHWLQDGKSVYVKSGRRLPTGGSDGWNGIARIDILESEDGEERFLQKIIETDDREVGAFDLSPDGTKIAYAEIESEGSEETSFKHRGKLWLLNIDGSSHQFIKEFFSKESPRKGEILDLEFSPDGTKVKVRHNYYFGCAECINTSIIDPSSKAQIDLSMFINEFQGVSAWSPDSNKVVIGTSFPEAERKLQIIDLEKSEIFILTTNASQPAWSSK